jgi:putative transposase
MRQPRQRHYVNPKEPGITVFISTTVLDFVHAFRRDEPRDAMVAFIAKHCRRDRAIMHAYVVMPHHVHLLIRLPETVTVSYFMNQFKSDSSDALVPLLTRDERRQFDQQRTLNGNTFWQRSFRALKVQGQYMFDQKVDYIHLNPIEAGYVEVPEDYRWSSARLRSGGVWTEESGIPYEAVFQSLRPRT